MQKGTAKGNGSKSKTNISMTQNYTSPGRKKFSQQSIRQFKIEIDHEIAKCLDTLDRQGLKFLKQTLRTSNMFNSTNFQVENENAKYESENSKINLDKPNDVKIPPNILSKYCDAEELDQIKKTQKERKKNSPKKKSKQQSSHFHQESRVDSKKQSYLSESRSQKQEMPPIGKKDSTPQVQKQKYGYQQPNKSINKNSRSNSSVKFNKPKQAHNVAEQSQKGREKKYESAQTKSSAKIKQIPPSQNSNSRVVKKTTIENKKTNEKISLGQRLSKKMQELHISKVGPTKKPTTQVKPKTQNKPSNPSNANQVSNMPEQTIEQEIIEGVQNQFQPQNSQDPDINESIISESIIHESFVSSLAQNHQSIKISKKINPLKPIVKDIIPQIQVKKIQGNDPKVQQSSKFQQENSKSQHQSSVDESKFMSNHFQSIDPQQSLIEKLSMSIQVDNAEIDKNSFQNSLDKQKFVEMSHIVEKINKLSPDKLLEIQKYIDFIQNKPNQQPKNSNPNIPSQKQTNKQAQSNFLNPPQIMRIQQGQDFTKNKSQTFQNNWIQKNDKNHRPMTQLEKQDNLTQKQSINHPNNSKPPLSIHRNDSRKGNREKKQKASMIFGNNSKSASRSRIKIDPDFQEEMEKPKQSKFKEQQKPSPQKKYLKGNSYYVSQPKKSQKVILTEEKPIRMQKIDFQEPARISSLPGESNVEMKSSQINLSKLQKLNIQKQEKGMKNEPQAQSPSRQLKQEKKLELKQSQLALPQQISSKVSETFLNIQYTEVKMLNVSNKRSMIKEKDVGEMKNRTKLKFKILSNRGHSSLYGLTGIQLFTIDNRRVIITEKQLTLNSTSNAKLLNLFNGNHYQSKNDQIYQSPLNKNEIIVELDKDNDKIAGILVFNFNKSSLESQKQVDQMEIYHNDSKMWKGNINRGAYNQIIDYATKIQFMQNFNFPTFQIPNQSIVISSKINKFKRVQTQTKTQKAQTQSKEIEPKVLNQRMQSEKEKLKNPTIGYNTNAPLKNQSFLQNLKQEKIKDEIKIEKRKNASQFSTKNFKLSDSIENLKGWNFLNENKPKDIQLQSQSAQIIAKTQRRANYDEFDSMLNGLQQNLQRQKSKSKIVVNSPNSNDFQNKNNSKVQTKQDELSLNKNKSQKEGISIKKSEQKTTSQQIQDFVNASIFKDKQKGSLVPTEKRKNPNPQNQEFEVKKNVKIEENTSNKNKDINIDDFLGELQEVLKNKGIASKTKPQKHIQIPILPQGSLIQIQIVQNWGHQALVGLHAIQFFDKQGTIVTPKKIESNKNHQNLNLLQALSNKNIINRDQKIQTKLGFDRNSTTILSFSFSSTQIFSLIRIWNYNGHRVHSNIGIKNLILKIDGKESFMGEIKRNQSTPQNFHKHFDAVLFTNDIKIMKKIKENDWLTELKNKEKTQKDLFKSTLINFNRPKTRNSENKNVSKENQQISSSSKNQKEIKVPKRQCWQYEPPQMPEGNFLVFLLHDTWGDQNFIGLNGIQIFDGDGRVLTKDRIAKIKAFPNSTGEKNDKRVVQNIMNGNNLSSNDTNIWLSTYQSDIEKIETGKANMIIVELSKRTKISGINIFNYSKTAERGVRQIQIQVNSMIAFRGYVKMFDEKSGQNCFHTTINFTKNVQILSKMNYETYNEDNIDQNVAHVNERKTVKA